MRTDINVILAAVVLGICMVLLVTATIGLSQSRPPARPAPIPKNIMLRIVRAEDERRWDNDLRSLLAHRNLAIRKRATLAAGRIGNEQSVVDLSELMQQDRNVEVRAMAAFAIGEVESAAGIDALLKALKDTREPLMKARSLEALGKIAAALPADQEARAGEIRRAIGETLKLETARRSAPDRLTILLGLTAALRTKAADSGPVVSQFLSYSDPRIRSDAANSLARLRLKDGNAQLRKLLISDSDANVRANAARVLGATEEKAAFEELLDRAIKDRDSRVRVSAIRALASLKDGRATVPLIEYGSALLASVSAGRSSAAAAPGYPVEANELLEIATTLGRLRQHSEDERTVTWLKQIRQVTGTGAPELEIALAGIHPANYLAQLGAGPVAKRTVQEALLIDWRAGSSFAQGLGEIAAVPDSTTENKDLRRQAEDLLRAMLDYRNADIIINTLVRVYSEYAIPDVLRAFAAFKPRDLSKVLARHLRESDVIIRGTAADLLGELPPDEGITQALIETLPPALQDKELNDAALSILNALAKQKNAKANEAIKTALDSPDHLVRRRAVALLKANGVGDFSSRIGIVQTRNTAADYERAISRMGRQVSAVISTSKGSFTISFLPDEAPLNVDNFIQLAKRDYFRGITVHRVVPNFVIQDGDPRGDGNGGPGYQIRCEINQAPYERGAVGMALSGKDTGGSQWFVTHAPQPHLDGGYTVFAHVVSGMEVVDRIVRGDVVESIVVKEPSGLAQRSRR